MTRGAAYLVEALLAAGLWVVWLTRGRDETMRRVEQRVRCAPAARGPMVLVWGPWGIQRLQRSGVDRARMALWCWRATVVGLALLPVALLVLAVVEFAR